MPCRETAHKASAVRIRQHVNPLGLSFESFRGDLPDLSTGRELELEVGCAEAQFLFERAEQDPSRLYLGMEIRDQLVAAVNREARARRLPVHSIFCNANMHLRELLPTGSVARVFLNFPDPWFKKRHHKRRIIQPDFVALIAARLAPGGYLHCATDWEDYAHWMLEVLSAEPLLHNTADGFAPRPDYRPLTKFEHRGLKLGHGVWDLVFRRS
jgi:tRNA (guanine-N7-)-methyltransferase